MMQLNEKPDMLRRNVLKQYLELAFKIDQERDALLWKKDGAGNITPRTLSKQEQRRLTELERESKVLLKEAGAQGIMLNACSRRG